MDSKQQALFNKVRDAHDAAVDERRAVARRIRDAWAERIEQEIKEATRYLDATVGRTIAEAVNEGLPKSKAREAIRTNSGAVWSRYVEAAEVELPDGRAKPEPTTGFVFDWHTGYAWRREQEDQKIPMFFLDERGAVVFAVNDNAPTLHVPFDKEARSEARKAEGLAYLAEIGAETCEAWSDNWREVIADYMEA